MTLMTVLMWMLASPSGEPNLKEAVQLYERGEYQRAAALLSQLSNSSSDAANARLWLGKSYLKLLKWDEAVQELRKAVQLNPSSSLYHFWLGRAYGEKASHVSIFTAFSWARKVVQELGTAQSLAPDNMEVRFANLQFYMDAPEVVGGGRSKAEAQVKEIDSLNPRMGYRARALLFEKDKKWVPARQQYVQATSEFPAVPEVWHDLADFLFDRSDFNGAVSNSRKALALREYYPDAELVLLKSEICLRTNLADAENKLNRLASGPLGDNDPAFDAVYYWLGQAYLTQEKRDEARQAFETALRFNPEHSEAKLALSRIS